VYGLTQRKAARITVVNRSRERAEDLARDFGPTVSVAGYDDLPDLLADASLLVNATSLGMQGGIRLRVRLDGLPKTAVVADLVYVPLRTDLLKDAANRGNRTVDGLGMLLHQAVPGFEKWFGLRPEVTPELRKLVEDDIGSNA
jgi:shikimate dehydrogenase